MDTDHSDAVVMIRSNKPRRYKLLARSRLKIPNGLTRKYDYTKHMPLIQVESEEEESEDIDSRAFRKVSNRNLRELLHQDRSRQQGVNGQGLSSGGTADDDDWDLSLTLPHPSPDRRCGCLPVPECTIS